MISKAFILIPVVTVLVIALFRAAFIFKPPVDPPSCTKKSDHERIKLSDDILNRFKLVLNTPTVSYSTSKADYPMLLKMIEQLKTSFPNIHSSPFISRELVSNYSLIYTIEGSDKALRPYMLTSHLDVVPVVGEKWSSDPFDAVLKSDNYLYARGTIDAKHLVMAMLEALEFSLKKKFRPKRSFYLIFGHDEEVGGEKGAACIEKILKKHLEDNRWDKLEYILDEGTMIINTEVPGVNKNLAMVGVVEKGYLNVKLTARGDAGNDAIPTTESAIVRLSSALNKFDANALPNFFGEGPERELIDVFATYSNWPYKLIYANFWLFKPLFYLMFQQNNALNAMMRTSTAVTLIQAGGDHDNVVPDVATAFINHRVHSLQTIDEVIELDRNIIDDPLIKVERHGVSKEPSSTAPYCDDCYAYQLLKHTILQVHPDTIVAPATFLASSDSIWYTNLTDAIYKFSAIVINLEEMKRFHGHDERISLKNYEKLINFYHHLIENSDSSKLDLKPKLRSEL